MIIRLLLSLALISLTSCAPTWYSNYGIESKTMLRDQSSVPKLIEALNDDSASVRARAAHLLMDIDNTGETVLALTQSLKDENAQVRRKAAIALGVLGNNSQAVIGGLMNVVTDSDAGVRLESIKSIYKLGHRGEEFIEKLKTASITDNHRQVRNTAASIIRIN